MHALQQLHTRSTAALLLCRHVHEDWPRSPCPATWQVKNSVGEDVREDVVIDPAEQHDLDNRWGEGREEDPARTVRRGQPQQQQGQAS